MIPAWNELGLLPPIRQGDAPVDVDRAPYRTNLLEFVERFALTHERVCLLKGLLSYRNALYTSNIREGFQWIDGSFLENIEMLEERHPRDIDCVTFYTMPPDETEETLDLKYPKLFQHTYLKAQYSVDAYYVGLDETFDEYLLDNITYWYSIWSHNRDFVWKGFVHIALDEEGDLEAQALLERICKERVYAND